VTPSNPEPALKLAPLVSKLRELKIDPTLYTGPGQEIIPPPNFTDRTIPFNYFYEQNPYVREQGTDEFGKPIVVNVQGRFTLTYGHYLEHNAFPVPTAPLKQVRSSHLVPQDLLDRMVAAMEERPIWTRRSFINRVRPYYSDNSMKIGIQMVGYQFKGGPWRDAVIKYGVDPRKDPQYRIYQTLAFKLNDFAPDSIVRNGFVRRMGKEESRRSHLWDGESYCTNGKFWQICDITDPTLVKLIEEAPLRDECDIVADGWWNNGSWSKFKSFMRAKMIAIKIGRLGSDNDEVKRKGYIYNSDLVLKLNQLPNVFPATYRNPVAVTTLLEGMEGVDGLEKIRYKYRPRDSYRDPLVAMGFGSDVRRKPKRRPNVTSQQDGQGGDPNARDSGDESGRGQNESGREGKPRYPDDAWAHILDSDLDSNVSGESGDEDVDEVNDTTMIADDRDDGAAGEAGEVDDNDDLDDEGEDEAEQADEEDELGDEDGAVDHDMEDDGGPGEDGSEGGFISDY
jgi:general transcription factor 3C polypeptide 5 (transcription factor C subunit 1)